MKINERNCVICQNNDCENHGKLVSFYGDCFNCEYIPFETNSFLLGKMKDKEKAKVLTKLFYKVAQKTNAEHYILDWLKQPPKED